MKRFICLFTFIALLLVSFSNNMMAQPLPGGSGTGPPSGNPLNNGPLGGPISDSLWLPLLIAMAYGMYKIYQLRLSRKEA
ncbi:MAG: hypothetical protein NTU98_05050 [Bacteroidetes bacterium]|nr:hypothetical protein [Bacteroidota bacterium]